MLVTQVCSITIFIIYILWFGYFFCTFVTFQYKGYVYDHEIKDMLLGIGGIGKSPVDNFRDIWKCSNLEVFRWFMHVLLIMHQIMLFLFSRYVLTLCDPPWTAAHQASLSFIISLSLLKLMYTESMMPSNHGIEVMGWMASKHSFLMLKYFHISSEIH